jgi:HEAT repeat protein
MKPGTGKFWKGAGLAAAGLAAFAIFADRAEHPRGDAGNTAADRAASPGDGAGILSAARPRGNGSGSGAVDSLPDAGATPGSKPTTIVEDWRTSPRLWVFSREDQDRVAGLLAALAAAVRDSNWQEVDRVIAEVRKLGPRAAGPLLDALLKDPDDRMRVYAANLLGQIQDTLPAGLLRDALRAYALPFLEATATTHDDLSMRHSALVALGKIGDPSSFEFLVDALRRSEAWPLVGDAARALSELRGVGITEALAELAAREPDARDRERLTRALAERQDSAAARTLAALAGEDPDLEVREAAVWGLSKLGSAEALATVVEIARGNELPEIRAAAARALGRPGDASHVPLLRDLLRSPGEPEVRTAAYRALHEIGTQDARSAIADYRPAVRVEAVLPGTQAEQLHLAPNDVITSYNGEPVKDAVTLQGLAKSTSTETTVPLVVDRGGLTVTYQVRGGLLGLRIEDGVVLD